jgi:Nicotinamide mononucleotide adenylyltransferase
MPDATVVIGRFSPYTVTQHAAMLNALQQPGAIAIVIGSAYHARTPRDPFTWQERQAMIELCAPDGVADRLRFVPVRDYYDDKRWAAAVQRAVQAALPEVRRPQLVPTSTQNLECYRQWLPEWPQLEPEGPAVDDKALLRVLLSSDAAVEQGIAPRRHPIETALAVVAPMLPPEDGGLPAPVGGAAALRRDGGRAALQSGREREMEWRPVRADILDRRLGRPGLGTCPAGEAQEPARQGARALPGGFLDPRERLLTSAIRELHEETAIGVPKATFERRLKDVVVFDHPDRAMRARTITHAHYFELQDERLPEVHGSDDAARAEWIPVSRLPHMEDQFFEDHFHILDHFFSLTN